MNIDEAARATRKYQVFGDGGSEAQIACDRMNLLAVLEAIREPSEVMVAEGEAAYVYHPKNIWSEMIYALIAEVGN